MKTLEEARAMSRAQVMQPSLAFLEAQPGPAKAAAPAKKKRIQGKKAPAVSKRGDAPRGGEKGTPVPKDFQGTRSVGASRRAEGAAAPVKYPRKLPTEAQLRDNAAKRAAMVVRDGLDASKPQDQLKSLRPY